MKGIIGDKFTKGLISGAMKLCGRELGKQERDLAIRIAESASTFNIYRKNILPRDLAAALYYTIKHGIDPDITSQKDAAEKFGTSQSAVSHIYRALQLKYSDFIEQMIKNYNWLEAKVSEDGSP